jgi:imidazolonepropionase-like amidohydrolase
MRHYLPFIISLIFFSITISKDQGNIHKIKTLSGKEITAAEMDEFIKAQMDSLGIPGMSIAMINDAKIVYHRVLGVTNVDTKEKQVWILLSYTHLNEAHKDAQNLFPTFLAIIKRFWESGVLITAGTDLGNPWITPGVSLHHELELLTSAGIPPLEVIKIATKNGAKALHILDNVGTIEVGKQADLILNANPIEDIKNTRKIEMVFQAGKLFELEK